MQAAIGYLRVSTREQGRSGLGLAAQRQEIEAFGAREGFTGIEVWFDKSELRGGEAWDRQIRKQVHDCALFIPLISANAHARDEGYFRLEWKLATDRSHFMAPDKTFLLPVVIDNTPQTDERIPDRFRELQWSRLPDGQVPPAFIERVRRLLSPESAAYAQLQAWGGSPIAGPAWRYR